MSSILIPAGYHIRSWKTNFRIWAAFLLGFGICLKNGSMFLSCMKAMHSSAQIFEAYIVIGSHITWFMGILLGSFLLLSDAPFVNDLSKYEIIRTGKIKWFWSQISYIFISSILYSLIIFIFLCILTVLYAEPLFENTWSEGIRILAVKQPVYVIRKFAFSFPFPEMIENLSPLGAAVKTMFFGSLYMSLTGFVIFAGNLCSFHGLGWVLAAMIHILGYISYANLGLVIPMKFSLLCCAVPAYHDGEMSSLYSFVLLSIVCIISIAAGRKIINKAELF